MPDTTTTVTTAAPALATAAPSIQQDQTVLQSLANDATATGKEILAVVHAYKAGGAAAAAALLPAFAPELERDYADIKAALPAVKAGYKTTEFWLVALVIGGVTGFTLAGKVPPIDATAAVTALTGIYAVVRGVLKK